MSDPNRNQIWDGAEPGVTTFLVDLTSGDTRPMPETTLAAAGLTGRAHLERWLIDHPFAIGDDLLLVTNELDHWGIKEPSEPNRLELLFLDGDGSPLVVEFTSVGAANTDNLRALEYAAFCAQLSLGDLAAEYARGNDVDVETATARLVDHAPALEGHRPGPVRVRLVATEFGPGLASLVLWLRGYHLDIGCIEVKARQLDAGHVVIGVRQLIPVPEAEVSLAPSRTRQGRGPQAAIHDTAPDPTHVLEPSSPLPTETGPVPDPAEIDTAPPTIGRQAAVQVTRGPQPQAETVPNVPEPTVEAPRTPLAALAPVPNARVTTEPSPSYEELRDRYRPETVRYLLVVESSPDPAISSQGFFYSPTLIGDTLYRGVSEAVYGEQGGVQLGDKGAVLERLCTDGFWLIDAVEHPINRLSVSARSTEIRNAVPSLVERCLELAPTDGVIICSAKVFTAAAPALREGGVNLLHTEALPLPLGNWRARFVRDFRQALGSSQIPS